MDIVSFRLVDQLFLAKVKRQLPVPTAINCGQIKVRDCVS